MFQVPTKILSLSVSDDDCVTEGGMERVLVFWVGFLLNNMGANRKRVRVVADVLADSAAAEDDVDGPRECCFVFRAFSFIWRSWLSLSVGVDPVCAESSGCFACC